MELQSSIQLSAPPNTTSRLPNGSHPSTASHAHYPIGITFGLIAVMALLGNLLVIIVLLRTKSLLGHLYSILLINLAIADMLTGAFILITPAFVIGEHNFPILEGLVGDMFCRLIGSQYFVFTTGKISIATVACLALERWYAMARPLRYRLVYTKRSLGVYLALIWCICSFLNMRALLEKELDSSTGECRWVTFVKSKTTDKVYSVVLCIMTFLIPLTISWGTFIHLGLLVRKSKGQVLNQGLRSKAAMQLLRMSVITAAVLGVCWLPNQIVFVLSKFDITQLDTQLHHVTAVLCVLNSSVNPWIYCASNRKYRRALIKLVVFWRTGNKVRREGALLRKTAFVLTVDSSGFTSNNGLRRTDWVRNICEESTKSSILSNIPGKLPFNLAFNSESRSDNLVNCNANLNLGFEEESSNSNCVENRTGSLLEIHGSLNHSQLVNGDCRSCSVMIGEFDTPL